MRELAGSRHTGIRVHVVAMIHRANRFTFDEVQRLPEVLGVAPRGETGVFAQGTLCDCALGPNGPLRFNGGQRGQADAGQQHDEGPAKTADAEGLTRTTDASLWACLEAGRAEAGGKVRLGAGPGLDNGIGVQVL